MKGRKSTTTDKRERGDSSCSIFPFDEKRVREKRDEDERGARGRMLQAAMLIEKDRKKQKKGERMEEEGKRTPVQSSKKKNERGDETKLSKRQSQEKNTHREKRREERKYTRQLEFEEGFSWRGMEWKAFLHSLHERISIDFWFLLLFFSSFLSPIFLLFSLSFLPTHTDICLFLPSHI